MVRTSQVGLVSCFLVGIPFILHCHPSSYEFQRHPTGVHPITHLSMSLVEASPTSYPAP